MADGVKRGQSGMKEVTVSVHPDSDALSSQGDPEDMAELDPGYVEERFRVDRRKLEAMLHQGEWGAHFPPLEVGGLGWQGVRQRAL